MSTPSEGTIVGDISGLVRWHLAPNGRVTLTTGNGVMSVSAEMTPKGFESVVRILGDVMIDAYTLAEDQEDQV